MADFRRKRTWSPSPKQQEIIRVIGLLEEQRTPTGLGEIAKRVHSTPANIRGSVLTLCEKGILCSRVGKMGHFYYHLAAPKEVKKPVRRADGILVCPPAYAEGFGFDYADKIFIKNKKWS